MSTGIDLKIELPLADRRNGNAWAPQQEHTILQRLPEYYFLSMGREEEVKIKQHSMYS